MNTKLVDLFQAPVTKITNYSFAFGEVTFDETPLGKMTTSRRKDFGETPGNINYNRSFKKHANLTLAWWHTMPSKRRCKLAGR